MSNGLYGKQERLKMLDDNCHVSMKNDLSQMMGEEKQTYMCGEKSTRKKRKEKGLVFCLSLKKKIIKKKKTYIILQ